MTSKRRILVTTALPYANADLHLGHILEHIQSDLWVRYQKLQGNECFSICGDDAHGTAITISAQKQNITPEELIDTVHQERLKDFAAYNIAFDYYHTTHSDENRTICHQLYEVLCQKDHITSRTITQLYDEEKEIFLADRYIKGICPRCNADDQYGDNCEVCGATYDAMELHSPKSTLSGTIPISRESTHFFFKLGNFTDTLTTWINSAAVSKEVANKLNEWLECGLKDWDISRDAPYFGFNIPGESNKYFYVWMDAPIGYMSSFQKLCTQNNYPNFMDYWKKDSTCELIHFIGKDIINFHCLFWPAMLAGTDFRLPSKVVVHGYLTVNGKKMSKSRGNFIRAKDYAEVLDPDYLRYYFATKLNNSIQDYDLNTEDFIQRVNSDIIGKIINIASRCARIINKNFDDMLAPYSTFFSEIVHEVQHASTDIAKYYESFEIRKVIQAIVHLADKINAWIDQCKPWIQIKTADTMEEAWQICSTGLNMFRILILYLKPVMPSLALNVEDFLNITPLCWDDHRSLLENHRIKPFKPLLTRLQPEHVKAILEKES